MSISKEDHDRILRAAAFEAELKQKIAERDRNPVADRRNEFVQRAISAGGIEDAGAKHAQNVQRIAAAGVQADVSLGRPKTDEQKIARAAEHAEALANALAARDNATIAAAVRRRALDPVLKDTTPLTAEGVKDAVKFAKQYTPTDYDNDDERVYLMNVYASIFNRGPQDK